jgi:protein-tyrosine-phosphatase
MRILFICRWNRFRSRVAEAYFNKINNNKKIVAESAGINDSYTDLDSFEVAVAAEMGLTLKGVPRKISEQLLDRFDRIIVVANDVDKSLFGRKYWERMEFWGVSDLNLDDRQECRRIISEIMGKVDELVKEPGKK